MPLKNVHVLRLIHVVLVVTRSPHVGHAELERVAAGHVVGGEAHVVLVVAGPGEGADVARRAVQVSGADVELRHVGVRSVAVDVRRLRPENPPFVVEREPALEQQLVRVRIRPRRLENVFGSMREVDTRFRRSGRAALVAVHEALVEMTVQRDLVLLRGLPGQVDGLPGCPGVAPDRGTRHVLRVRHQRQGVKRIAAEETALGIGAVPAAPSGAGSDTCRR